MIRFPAPIQPAVYLQKYTIWKLIKKQCLQLPNNVDEIDQKRVVTGTYIC